MARSQSELAQSIALAAHKGQVDKAGKPYIEHPAHVASVVQGDAAKAVAWLRDVVEDTPLTFADLRGRGIAPEVIEALKLLTRDESVPYLEYVRSLKPNPLARAVKLADLRHNSDLSRLPRITENDQRRAEKYAKAIAILEGRCSYSSAKRDPSFRWAFSAALTQDRPGLRPPPAALRPLAHGSGVQAQFCAAFRYRPARRDDAVGGPSGLGRTAGHAPDGRHRSPSAACL